MSRGRSSSYSSTVTSESVTVGRVVATMQRLSHYLPRLSQAGASRTSCFTARIPYNAFRANARLASSIPPNSTKHMTDAVSNIAKAHVREHTTDQKWETRSKRALEDALTEPPADAYAGILLYLMFLYRLLKKDTTGRSVRNTGNLAATFRSLQDILTRNKVFQTQRMGQRHEKKGEKRNRLKSERWRKQFANEVRPAPRSAPCQSHFLNSCRSVKRSSL